MWCLHVACDFSMPRMVDGYSYNVWSPGYASHPACKSHCITSTVLISSPNSSWFNQHWTSFLNRRCKQRILVASLEPPQIVTCSSQMVGNLSGSKQEHKRKLRLSLLADKRCGKENSFQISWLIVNDCHGPGQTGLDPGAAGEGYWGPWRGGFGQVTMEWTSRLPQLKAAHFGLLCREICSSDDTEDLLAE